MNGYLTTIQDFLETHHISPEAGFIIAVSGGADSITLLHAFKYMNLKIHALHCNFSLRDKESNMDEQFVKRFCDSYGIGLSVKKFDTRQYAKEKGISIEMAARELRYNWFMEMKEKKKMDYIVVGHHADDVAETIFINLCRGTGIKGLTGIQAVNGCIIRPLLGRSRADILQYIEDNQLGFRTDSTNNSLDYVRNKIRHKIIPVCKEINPSFLATVEENCNSLKGVELIYRHALEQLKAEIVEEQEGEILIHIGKTLASPSPFTFLFEILKPMGFNKTQIRDILDSCNATPGKQFLSDKYLLTKGRTYWRMIDNHPDAISLILIAEEGIHEIGDHIFRIISTERTDNFAIPNDPDIAYLDADKVNFPLTVRNWQTGDWFCPIGMKKSRKKLSDFFTDQKFSAKQKRECLLLLSGDKVTWIAGYRLDDRFKITSSTRNILIIKREVK